MLTVYADQDVFETIVLYKKETPNWYKIFCKYSEICLNISDEKLIEELTPGTPIFEFINANAGKSPIALKEYFDDLHTDYSLLAQQPRAAFFLDIDKPLADTLQAEYGIIVQSNNSIDENILTGSFKKKLLKNDIIQNGKNIGWDHLLRFTFPHQIH